MILPDGDHITIPVQLWLEDLAERILSVSSNGLASGADEGKGEPKIIGVELLAKAFHVFYWASVVAALDECKNKNTPNEELKCPNNGHDVSSGFKREVVEQNPRASAGSTGDSWDGQDSLENAGGLFTIEQIRDTACETLRIVVRETKKEFLEFLLG